MELGRFSIKKDTIVISDDGDGCCALTDYACRRPASKAGGPDRADKIDEIDRKLASLEARLERLEVHGRSTLLTSDAFPQGKNREVRSRTEDELDRLRPLVVQVLREEEKRKADEENQREAERQALYEGSYGDYNFKVNLMAKKLGLTERQKDFYHATLVEYDRLFRLRCQDFGECPTYSMLLNSVEIDASQGRQPSSRKPAPAASPQPPAVTGSHGIYSIFVEGLGHTLLFWITSAPNEPRN